MMGEHNGYILRRSLIPIINHWDRKFLYCDILYPKAVKATPTSCTPHFRWWNFFPKELMLSSLLDPTKGIFGSVVIFFQVWWSFCQGNTLMHTQSLQFLWSMLMVLLVFRFSFHPYNKLHCSKNTLLPDSMFKFLALLYIATVTDTDSEYEQ